MLKLAISPPATLPGATYAVPSAAPLLAAALHPSQSGTLPKRLPDPLGLVGYHFTDSALGIGGTMLVLAGAWAFVAGQVRRRRRDLLDPNVASRTTTAGNCSTSRTSNRFRRIPQSRRSRTSKALPGSRARPSVRFCVT